MIKKDAALKKWIHFDAAEFTPEERAKLNYRCNFNHRGLKNEVIVIAKLFLAGWGTDRQWLTTEKPIQNATTDTATQPNSNPTKSTELVDSNAAIAQ